LFVCLVAMVMAAATQLPTNNNGDENLVKEGVLGVMKKNTLPEFKSLCMIRECVDGTPAAVDSDPLNWGKEAAAMQGSHWEEVKKMVKIFSESNEIALEGVSLTVAHVTAVARRPEVRVVLDAAVAKSRVDESSNWVLQRMIKGTDIYGVTTGFGATSHRRTQQGVELQKELIRYYPEAA